VLHDLGSRQVQILLRGKQRGDQGQKGNDRVAADTPTQLGRVTNGKERQYEDQQVEARHGEGDTWLVEGNQVGLSDLNAFDKALVMLASQMEESYTGKNQERVQSGSKQSGVGFTRCFRVNTLTSQR